MDPSMIMEGAQQFGNLLGNVFTNPEMPYQNAMNSMNQYYGQGAGEMQPYTQAGSSAIPAYQNWASSMKNPTSFINGIMNNYQESPYAKYMQNQAVRSSQNAGSASGLVGSTPYNQQVEQNASNISSQDMNNWMQNVLGVNQQYGNAQGNLMGQGEQAGNALMGLYENQGNNAANLSYNEGTAENQQTGNILSDLF